jgi:hypothetical protein
MLETANCSLTETPSIIYTTHIISAICRVLWTSIKLHPNWWFELCLDKGNE